MPSFSDVNPLANVSMGNIGMIALVIFVAILFLGLVGLGIFLWLQKKQLKYSIPLEKKIGNNTIRVATYKAKEIKIGMAGDKLWYVPKAKKYISPATIQTAPNEYTHFEREDGEWINIGYPDIDEEMKQKKVKFVHADMRAQRISIGNILEDRFKDKKSWWEKYGHLVTHVIFYFVVCLCMVIIFHQWGTIIDRSNELLQKIIEIQDLNTPETVGVVPAFVMLALKPFRRNKNGN